MDLDVTTTGEQQKNAAVFFWWQGFLKRILLKLLCWTCRRPPNYLWANIF